MKNPLYTPFSWIVIVISMEAVPVDYNIFQEKTLDAKEWFDPEYEEKHSHIHMFSI